MAIAEALLGLGGNLISGLFNKSNNEENARVQQMINAQNLAWSKEQFAQNYQNQKEFAQHGIQWKADDARAAGLHPLVGMGANTMSFSPASVGGEGQAWKSEASFQNMGQDLSRAAKAMASANEREEVDNEQARKLSLEKAGLENDILRADLVSKVARTGPRAAQLGPPMPVSDRIPLPRPGPRRTVSQGAAVSEDEIKQKEEDYPATRISRPFGYPLYSNPYFGDAQSHEDRYGENELASMLKWGVNMAADHIYSGYRNAQEPFWGPRSYRRPTHRDPWVSNSARR